VLICLGTGYDLCGGSYLDPKDQVYCNRTLGDKHTSIKISVNDSAPSGLTSYIFTKKPNKTALFAIFGAFKSEFDNTEQQY